jgi:hypothetical protein
MHPIALSPTLHKNNGQAANPAFSVVAVHDGIYAGIRVQEALEWLKDSFSTDLQLSFISWSFEDLAKQHLRALTIRAASAADAIIVSVSDDEKVPAQVKVWLNGILAEQRGTRPILIALHDERIKANGFMGPFCTHLKKVAESLQTEFMCNEDFDKRLDRDFAAQRLRQKSPDSFHWAEPFEREFYTTPRYWGIND